MKRNKVMGVSITVVDDQKVVLNLFDIGHHLSHQRTPVINAFVVILS